MHFRLTLLAAKDVIDVRGSMDGLPTIDGIVKHKGGDCKMLSAVFKTALEKLDIPSFYLFLKEVTKTSKNEYSYTGMVHMVVIANEKSNWVIFNNTEIVPAAGKPKVGDILDLKSSGLFKVDKVFSKYSDFFNYYQNNLCTLNCNSEMYYQFLWSP